MCLLRIAANSAQSEEERLEMQEYFHHHRVRTVKWKNWAKVRTGKEQLLVECERRVQCVDRFAATLDQTFGRKCTVVKVKFWRLGYAMLDTK